MVRDGGGEIELHEPDRARLRELPSIPRLGALVWLRVLLPELLHPLPRVLYLDADTLVTDSIDDLWETALGDMALAGVANVVEPAMRPHVAALGLDHRDFFNGGVLLLNLELMRQEGAAERLIGFATQNTGLLEWGEQDAMNVVFGGRWRALHPRWNAQNSLWVWREWSEEVFGAQAVVEARGRPAVLHFEGPSVNKPWHYLCQHPWRDEYRRTLARTPWAGTPLQDRSPATQLIRMMPPRVRVPAFLRLQRLRAARSRPRRPGPSR
jgi:lipopolysaccharide biosynthesis glycosyltransferase